MKPCRLRFAALLFVAIPSLNYAQQTPAGCSPAAAQLKATAIRLRSEHPDVNNFIVALDKAVGFDTGSADMIYSDETVHRSDEISIAVSFPYRQYRADLIEAIRTREPIAQVAVPGRVVVSVFVFQIGAPNIMKVVVERNGREVKPVASTLRPTTQCTALGATATLNEGQVSFACSAFAPGASVTVIAIPTAGANFTKAFNSATLVKLQPGAPVTPQPPTTMRM